MLPDGTLFGEGIKTRIKEQLLETCNPHTIVRLPNGVFNPYTGIKTNLLLLQQGPNARPPKPGSTSTLSCRLQELHQDPADAHRGIRGRKGMVGGR